MYKSLISYVYYFMIEQLLGNYRKINTGLLNTQKLGSHPKSLGPRQWQDHKYGFSTGQYSSLKADK